MITKSNLERYLEFRRCPRHFVWISHCPLSNKIELTPRFLFMFEVEISHSKINVETTQVLLLSAMQEIIKHLFRFFMSAKPLRIYSLLTRRHYDVDVCYWCSRILGLVSTLGSITARQIDHQCTNLSKFISCCIWTGGRSHYNTSHSWGNCRGRSRRSQTARKLNDISYVSSVYHLVSIPIT